MEGLILNLKLATRRSKLAQVQTDLVINLLKEKYNSSCEKILIETLGDKVLDLSLEKIGGKGVFVKDIEDVLLDKKADAAVHSMKDVPYEIPKGFEIVAMPYREDVRDAFVSMNGVPFSKLRNGAKIGTGSKRRAAQIKYLRPDVEIVPIRGNVQTRIDKIERENLDGIILAAAGLKRLNMESIITEYFNIQDVIPAIGQGAIGIEVEQHSATKEIFENLDNTDIRTCVEAERSFMRILNGDCHSTIGAYATIDGEYLYMIGIFEVNRRLVKKDIEGKREDFIKIGEKLAKKIVDI